MAGVEAVIDKDSTAALLARDLHADALLLLTDVDAVYRDFGGPHETSIGGATTPTLLETLPPLASGGSMGGPKVARRLHLCALAGVSRELASSRKRAPFWKSAQEQGCDQIRRIRAHPTDFIPKHQVLSARTNLYQSGRMTGGGIV